MGQIADQYRTIAAAAGWVERPDLGRLRFDGADAQRFLQALLTNDVQALSPGNGVYAAYLTPHGRMICDLRVYRRPDHLLATVPASDAATLAARFDQLIFTEDLRVTDVSTQIVQISTFGDNAPALLSHAFSLEALLPDQLAMLPVLGSITAGDVVITRNDEMEMPAFDLFVEATRREAVIERLEELGAIHASLDVLDALRIEAGRPKFGVDLTNETIPLEAGLLDRAISTTKGCYVGQEIIIRILHRGGGRVARNLVRLAFDSAVTDSPPRGTPVLLDGQEIGRVTSAAESPLRGVVVALAYVQRDHATMGLHVALPSALGGHDAEIIGIAG